MSPNELSILIWNVHATPLTRDVSTRLERVADEILELEPDLVLLQEVWMGDQAATLDRWLGEKYELVEPSGGRVGWTNRGGLVTLVRRSHAVTDSEFLSFSTEGSPWRFWEGDAYGNKGILRVDVVFYERVKISALNTHLQSEYGKGLHSEIRLAQLRELREVAEGIQGGELVLAGGDLNTLPDEPIFGEVAGYWRELTETLRNECRCGTRFLGDGREEGWIDYLLHRPGGPRNVEVLEARLLRNEAADDPYSDHHGVLLRLKVGEAASR